MATKLVRFQAREVYTDDEILLRHEPGVKNGVFKIGDGINSWSKLPYVGEDLTPYQLKEDSDLQTEAQTIVGAINEINANYQTHKDERLETKSKYIIEAINEVNNDLKNINFDPYQTKEDERLETESKDIVEAINEVKDGLKNIDFDPYQTKEDKNLKTTNKEVVGAINELNDDLKNYQTKQDDALKTKNKNIVDAINELNSKQVPCTSYLINGEGKYSFVQVTGPGGAHGSSEPDKHKPQSTAPGRNAAAFGVQGESAGDCTFTAGYQARAYEKGCVAFGTSVAGRTSQEWIDYYYNSETGEIQNNSSGLLEVPDTVTDYENQGIIEKDGIKYYVLGPSNSKYRGFLLNPCFSAGQGALAKGLAAIALGYSAKALGDYSFAINRDTQSQAPYGYAGGRYSVNRSTYGLAHGYYIYTSEGVNNQVAFGRYNKDNKNALFQIGNGGSSSTKSNAFEVLRDGRAKVQSAPVENDDVVRKIDLAGLGGATTNAITLTNEEKANACNWLGAVKSVTKDSKVLVYTNDNNSDQTTTHYLGYSKETYIPYAIPMIYGAAAGKATISGYLLTADPINAYHCANKKYVDDAIAALKAQFESYFNQ